MAVNPDRARNNTLDSFFTALTVNGALLGVQVGAFIILKRKLERIYSPRTYLPPLKKRSKELPKGPFSWLPFILFSPTKDIIRKNGLDAYMFLRYIKMLVWIFFVFTVATWGVLLPINAIVINPRAWGLDRFSWGDITGQGPERRYTAHVVLAYVLTFFVLYMIRKEMLHFLGLRHQFLVSKSHSRLPQARTVLISNVADEYADERELRTFANFVPGGVDRVWLYRDTKGLNKIFTSRQELCVKLEKTISKLLRTATLAWKSRVSAQRKIRNRKPKDDDAERGPEPDLAPPTSPTLEFLDDLVPPSKRPKHRVGFRKVDTINWCRDEIAKLNKEIRDARAKIQVNGKFLGSAFVRCNWQLGAHILTQCVSHQTPLVMYDKWIEAHPNDIVWKSLDQGPVEARTKYVISWAATFGLIIGWAFPTALVGSLSNASDLCERIPFLLWLCDCNGVVRGFIEGALPPALLTLLFILLPLILRALATFEGTPRYSLIRISVYRRFYVFLLIHGFLIVTLTSGITAAIRDILDDPARTIQLLAAKLPRASTFFMTYMVTKGLSGAGSALIQLIFIVNFTLKKSFLGRTPRQAYSVTFLMPSANFGVKLPQLSLLATIGFAYSIISPVINGLALLTFFLFYIAWKFLFLQVFDQPDEFETGGLYFPMAVSNLFVGLYIEQVTLASLFFIKASSQRRSSIVEAIFLTILVFVTAIAQYIFAKTYAPITQYLPVSIAMQKLAKSSEGKKRKKKKKLLPTGEDTAEDNTDIRKNRIRDIRRRFVGRPTERRGSDESDNDESSPRGPPPSSSSTSSPRQPGTADLRRRSSATSSEASDQPNKSKSLTASSSKRSRRAASSPATSSNESSSSSDDSDADKLEDDEHTFDHPAIYVEQQYIWIPKDILGLSRLLIKDFKAVGVKASDIGAVMDEKGVVEVTRSPPDEDWAGGQDA